VFHAVPVIYKGSGFYTTDYGRPKPPADNVKDSKDSSESKTSTTPDTKSESDSKPAAATPSSESKP
jgi:predicted nucleic acid-binding Zn ribbon protein